MADGPLQRPTGHVFRVERKHGAVWYAKYRLPDGRRVQRKIGPAWSGRGRPAAAGVRRAAARGDHDADDRALDCFIALSASTRTKAIVLLHGIFARAGRVWGLPSNPVADVEKPPLSRSGDIDVFSPEEVYALVRAAASEQDAAIYLTAAFTGLRRGELLALRWRDVDFPGSTIRVRGNYSEGVLTTPKSGKIRAVPMAPDVAAALARLGDRENWVGDDDLVFVGVAGGYLDGSALRRRHGSGWSEADIRRVQEWMGHSSIQTTMQYLHYAPRSADAQLVAVGLPRRGPGGRDALARFGASPNLLETPRLIASLRCTAIGGPTLVDPVSRARAGDAAPHRGHRGRLQRPADRWRRRHEAQGGTLGDAPGQHPRCVPSVAADRALHGWRS